MTNLKDMGLYEEAERISIEVEAGSPYHTMLMQSQLQVQYVSHFSMLSCSLRIHLESCLRARSRLKGEKG